MNAFRLLRGAALVAEQLSKEAAPELRKAALFARQQSLPSLKIVSVVPSPPAARPEAARATGTAPAAPAPAAPVASAPRPVQAVEPARSTAPPVAPSASAAPPAAAPPPAEASEAAGGARSAAPAEEAASSTAQPAEDGGADDGSNAPTLRVEAVPSSALGRAYHFGVLGASVLTSGLGELARRRVSAALGGNEADAAARTAFVNERSAAQMAATLTKLRGAALKLGQLLSLQDEGAMPAQMQAVFAKVRASANVMPPEQLHATIAAELGADWRTRVRSFQEAPLAAASIGQVHRVVLPDGRLGALKAQYPGVADSVDADLANLRRLAHYTGALPKTLFVDNIIKVAREELLAECDYAAEAASTERYGALLRAALATDPRGLAGKVETPRVIAELSSGRVLTTELMLGEPIEAVARMSLGRRNAVASRVLLLTLRELFEWRFVQTDPNWGNYLYDARRDVLSMLDFGAAREYPKPFVDKYLRMVDACARRDRDGCVAASVELGFLTGEEHPEMVDAHVAAGFVLGEPFGAERPYDFAGAQLSARVREHVPAMMRHRLRPPPDEIYSLHRKLSGAYMLCIRLGATIDCREAFEAVRDGYAFGPAADGPEGGGSGVGSGSAGARRRGEPTLT